MTRPALVFKEILEILLNGPMYFYEIREHLENKSKINRATIYKNIKKAKEYGYIEEDKSKKYHLTLWGKANVQSIVLPIEFTSFEVFTQIVDRLNVRNKRPTAKSTIVMKDAKRIKELDDATIDIERFLTHDGLGLIENNTFLKAAVAALVDTILDLKAKDIGMKTILDQEFREVRSPFNQDTYFPTYDYLKRYKQLAETTFNVLIEFDGKKWVESQNFSDVEEGIEANRTNRKGIYQHIRSMGLSKRINKVIYTLDPTNVLSERSLEALRLFETTDLLEEYVYNCFKLYSKIEDEKKLRRVVLKSLELGYINYETRKFRHLKLNKSKKAEFFKFLWQLEREDDIFEEGNFSTTGLPRDIEDNQVNNIYEHHEVLIKEVLAEMEKFQSSFLNLLIKFKDRFDKAQYYELYKGHNITEDPSKAHLVDVQLYADSLQELLRLFHSKLLLYLQRSIVFWPRRIHNKRVLNKLNSILFSKITEMCTLLRKALTFEVGDAFNGYLDNHILRKIDITTDLLDYTKKMSDPIIEKECQSLLNSFTHVYSECQSLSYPDLPSHCHFNYK